jgi:hypothetical protein
METHLGSADFKKTIHLIDTASNNDQMTTDHTQYALTHTFLSS